MEVTQTGMSSDFTDKQQSAIETAAELRDDLEAIAASDLPFAYDAECILEELERAEREESTDP